MTAPSLPSPFRFSAHRLCAVAAAIWLLAAQAAWADTAAPAASVAPAPSDAAEGGAATTHSLQAVEVVAKRTR